MTGFQADNVQPLRIADAKASVRHVFIRDLVLMCSIGVYDHEHVAPQRIRVNLDLTVSESHHNDNIDNVVCYEKVSNKVRDIVNGDHTNLCETLAEKIAASCLEDIRVRCARIRVEKLDVFEDIASVGIEIERFNTSL
ncbi:MAG: dihydroneopterin aldolase [Methylocystaceae bacterium]|nr:dihydroneopterin aldolase [Methylocystaceae bacterium]